MEMAPCGGMLVLWLAALQGRLAVPSQPVWLWTCCTFSLRLCCPAAPLTQYHCENIVQEPNNCVSGYVDTQDPRKQRLPQEPDGLSPILPSRYCSQSVRRFVGRGTSVDVVPAPPRCVSPEQPFFNAL